MQNAYEAHQIIERRARPPGDRCLSAIDLTAAAPEDEIAKTVQYNPSRAVTVPRLPQQPQEKVDGAPPGQPQAGKPGNLFSMWKQQKQDLPGTYTKQLQGSLYYPRSACYWPLMMPHFVRHGASAHYPIDTVQGQGTTISNMSRLQSDPKTCCAKIRKSS